MQMPDDENGKEYVQTGDELPVKLDTLMVGGQRPEVDDHVEVTVAGTISQIIDDCAYVKLETANDEPIEEKTVKAEEESLGEQSRQMDMGGPLLGGY
jgi:hypothetical protein